MHIHEKRFDYNISPSIPYDHETELHQPHYVPLTRKHKETALSSMSPTPNRTQLNVSYDDRYKQTLPYSSHSHQNHQNNQNYQKYQNNIEQRGRTSSSNGPRTNQYKERDIKNYLRDDKPNFQTTKNSLKEDKSFLKPQVHRNTSNNKVNINKHDINRLQDPYRQTYDPKAETSKISRKHLQQNSNFSNVPHKTRKIELEQPSCKQVTEKQLLDKIGRINKLNEEINSRLQRMLTKIQDCE